MKCYRFVATGPLSEKDSVSLSRYEDCSASRSVHETEIANVIVSDVPSMLEFPRSPAILPYGIKKGWFQRQT